MVLKWQYLNNINSLVLLAIVLRLVLLLYGQWQDAVLHVPYTDVDYHVFTDAATHINNGLSPYSRDTYRYSPVVAYVMLGNVRVHPALGKVIVSAADVVSGVVVYRVSPRGRGVRAAALALLNPVTMVISTRGNCDSLVTTLLLLVVAGLHSGRHRLLPAAGMLYGLATHLRLYPAIYLLPLLYYLQSTEKRPMREYASKQFWFLFSSALSFSLLAAYFYDLYGPEFVTNSYLYHLQRSDVRHNFSVYFYPLYLSYDAGGAVKLALMIFAFLPQVVIQLMVSYKCYRDLPMCMFLQTVLFIIYNKVYTAQYFIWFVALLPLVLSRVKLGKQLRKYASLWCMGLLSWLSVAYLLEFHGVNTFILIWLASLAFHIINVIGCLACIKYIEPEVF